MSEHLMADWVPSLPSLGGQTLVGWPQLLTESVQGRYLALQSTAGLTERQWKSFLSWMAGVCGTREVLDHEGYDWIAPLSAFYAEAKQSLLTAKPPAGFHPNSLTVQLPANPVSRLRPDYIAIRKSSQHGKWEVALVEAKGTADSLEDMQQCPSAWSAQVRNAEVLDSGTRLRVDRHLVVAVRSNPNAKYRRTRRFQIRAWNEEKAVREFPDHAAVDIVAAALYGLCNNIGLYETARAISLGSRLRFVEGHDAPSSRSIANALSDRGRAAQLERELEELKVATVAGRFRVRLADGTRELLDLFERGAAAEEIAPRLREITSRRRDERSAKWAEGRRGGPPLVHLEPMEP